MEEAEQLSDNSFSQGRPDHQIGGAEDLKNSVPFQKRLIIQARTWPNGLRGGQSRRLYFIGPMTSK
jgi:hypothetical protein